MTSANKKDGILLESGTNEVEIIEFYVRGQRFGVNVAKVKQIIPFDKAALSSMPKTPIAFRGVYLHRDTTIPMIDLGDALHLEPLKEGEVSPLLLICNFNLQTIAFAIDGVNRIHRLSWASFTPLNHYLASSCDSIIGSVNIDQHEILVIDLEQIVAEYDPKVKAMYDGEENEDVKAAGNTIFAQHIFMAEDSTLIRAVLGRDMKKAGFENVTMFPNGKEALDAITALANKIKESGGSFKGCFDVLVTDIEMPLLDGLTLCRRVKKELKIDVPVMVYSSLINAEMSRKCQEVGADAFFSKPHVENLVEAIKKKIKELNV